MTGVQENSTGSGGAHGGGAAAISGFGFQALVGASFVSSMLGGSRLDERLKLGPSSAVNVRFETEAPVDDILIATSDAGFVAIQAKINVRLEKSLESRFGQVVSQFVRHWLECRDGDESLGWNRPLDADRDRLVLAVNPNASSRIRCHLPLALRKKARGSTSSLSGVQRESLEDFTRCVDSAWRSITKEDLDPRVVDELSSLVTVLEFDVGGAHKALLEERLRQSIVEGADPIIAMNALESVCLELMASSQGVDIRELRNTLIGKGVDLKMPPSYSQDIEALRNHSNAVIGRLKNQQRIQIDDEKFILVKRECQEAASSVAIDGSFLVIGEPGSGKSGVMGGIAQHLLAQGDDVVAIAVDRISVETLEGLSRELGLSHPILEVMEAWDGAKRAWLIVDSLDAVRGGKGEQAFRVLIQRVLESNGRWGVIASIRSFDLRMGQQFRSLFKGAPSSAAFNDPSFSQVRHVLVPTWSDSEFDQLLQEAPSLSSALESAPIELRKLLMVPFNTQLACELLSNGVRGQLRTVASQAELLGRYWEHRVGVLGTPAEACLRQLIGHMVEHQSLQARKLEVQAIDTSVLDSLQEKGVLVAFKDEQWVQFRHHILFDFAASRVWLNADDIVAGSMKFRPGESVGLMLAPALAFVLQGLWHGDPERKGFWKAARSILADEDGDPVLKSVCAKLGAEFPQAPDDTSWIAQQVNANDEDTIGALKYLCGALGVVLDESAVVKLTPWTNLLASMSLNEERLAMICRFLLFKLLGQPSEHESQYDLGRAARMLLDFGIGSDSLGVIVESAIGYVADTYATEPEESRRLLEKVFDHDRLKDFAWVEVPAVCRKIESIAASDANFAAEVYRHTYAHEVVEDRPTHMGSSQILALVSNARQDYGMAHHSLEDYYPVFLENHPSDAVSAVVHAVNGYVARKHPIAKDAVVRRMVVQGAEVGLQPDRSFMWAHDPATDHPQDAEKLIVKLVSHLKSCAESEACRLAGLVIQNSSLAVFWARMFMVAGMRKGALSEFLLPFALQEPFLIELDTRKDAIDVVAQGYESLSEEARIGFEQSAFQFDFSRSGSPDESRHAFLMTLFSAIGEERLSTNRARRFLGKFCAGESRANVRPIRVLDSDGEVSSPSFHWIKDLDREHPANECVIDRIELAKQMLAHPSGCGNSETPTLQQVLSVVADLAESLLDKGVNARLRLEGEHAIGDTCKRVVSLGLITKESQGALDRKLLELVSIAANSKGPELQEDTESSFEQRLELPSPAARVEAAGAILGLISRCPDFLDVLVPQMDMLLADLHPAVRLEAGMQLLLIRNTHRCEFWKRLRRLLAKESNLGVIEHLVSNVLGRLVPMAPESVEEEVLKLLGRFDNASEAGGRLQRRASTLLAILWIYHGRRASHSLVQQWTNAPDKFSEELEGVLGTIRGGFVAGLNREGNGAGKEIRCRVFELAEELVKSVNERLAEISSEPNGEEVEDMRVLNLQKIVNVVCVELRFSVYSTNEDGCVDSDLDLGKFLNEAQSILELLGRSDVPSTIHQLLELMEYLRPANPRLVFDITTKSLLDGGGKGGYQFEQMGKNLLIKFIGVFLADHKDILASRDRRQSLIKCLAMFADAGWPEAQQLLYRLPELVR